MVLYIVHCRSNSLLTFTAIRLHPCDLAVSWLLYALAICPCRLTLWKPVRRDEVKDSEFCLESKIEWTVDTITDFLSNSVDNSSLESSVRSYFWMFLNHCANPDVFSVQHCHNPNRFCFILVLVLSQQGWTLERAQQVPGDQHCWRTRDGEPPE